MNQQERDEEEQIALLESKQLQTSHPALQDWRFSSWFRDRIAIAQSLKQNSVLTKLHLCPDLQVHPPEGLLHFIQHTTTLKSLRLPQHLPARPVQVIHPQFMHALCYNTSIERVECDHWRGRDVAQLLRHLQKLKELTLGNVEYEHDDDSKELATALKAHPNLVSLGYRPGMSSNPRNSLMYLELDQGHISLRNLTLYHDISTSDFLNLRHVLKSSSCPLHHLAIRLSNTEQGFNDILDGLECNTSLLSLTLSAILPIQAHQANLFQRFLAAESCSLKSLSLYYVNILDGVTKVPLDIMVGRNALTSILLCGCLQNANLWRSLLSNSINSIECKFGDFEGLELQEFDSICQAIARSVTPIKRFVIQDVKSNSAIPLTRLYEALGQSPSQLSSLCLRQYCVDNDSLAVEDLCRLFQRTTTQCEIESSNDLIQHHQLKESDRGLRVLEIKGLKIPINMWKSLFHALTLNSTLETLDIGYWYGKSGEDYFPALFFYLPNIKSLRKLKLSDMSKLGICSEADNLLKALEQNTSLTSFVLDGPWDPNDADHERAYRLRVKSICQCNRRCLLSQVPSVVWITALFHLLDSENLNRVYSLISNRLDILDQVNGAGTKRKLNWPVHDGLT